MNEKRCPKCEETKPLTAFYKVKARSDGYASWCKTCTNKNRPKHKPSAKRDSYRIVADVVAKEGKPSACPKCLTPNVPSHQMRGRLVEGEVRWSCVSCRSKALAAARQVSLFCDWCCDEFNVPPSSAHKRFCTQDCMDSWRAAKRNRREREQQSDLAAE